VFLGLIDEKMEKRMDFRMEKSSGIMHWNGWREDGKYLLKIRKKALSDKVLKVLKVVGARYFLHRV